MAYNIYLKYNIIYTNYLLNTDFFLMYFYMGNYLISIEVIFHQKYHSVHRSRLVRAFAVSSCGTPREGMELGLGLLQERV